MIEVRNISKSFEDKLVLDDLSIIFEEGKTNLVIGGSGSGKTVLIKCLVALYKVDSGSIIYHGRDFTLLNEDEKRDVRKEIGMVFQGGALFDSQSVEENVAFPLHGGDQEVGFLLMMTLKDAPQISLPFGFSPGPTDQPAGAVN